MSPEAIDPAAERRRRITLAVAVIVAIVALYFIVPRAFRYGQEAVREPTRDSRP